MQTALLIMRDRMRTSAEIKKKHRSNDQCFTRFSYSVGAQERLQVISRNIALDGSQTGYRTELTIQISGQLLKLRLMQIRISL